MSIRNNINELYIKTNIKQFYPKWMNIDNKNTTINRLRSPLNSGKHAYQMKQQQTTYSSESHGKVAQPKREPVYGTQSIHKQLNQLFVRYVHIQICIPVIWSDRIIFNNLLMIHIQPLRWLSWYSVCLAEGDMGSNLSRNKPVVGTGSEMLGNRCECRSSSEMTLKMDVQ